MSLPKFHPGQRVIVLPERGSPMRPGVYTITRVMPASPEGIQYRAKNEMDTHERVLHEAQCLQPDEMAHRIQRSGAASGREPQDKGAPG